MQGINAQPPISKLQFPSWSQWNKALQASLVETQSQEGALAGSWSPETRWGGYGGRVYSTATATLCLEVYYRFLPLYVEAASRDRLLAGGTCCSCASH